MINRYFCAKSKEIRDLLKLGYWDKEFSTGRMTNNNPFANFVMVDGFMVPVSELPEEYQEIVRQAWADGGSIYSFDKSNRLPKIRSGRQVENLRK